MSKTIEEGENKHSESSLESIIQGFLKQYSYLHEFRLQKLVYIADLIKMLSRRERLTNADFKPYMYGSYSEDLSKSLEELEKEGKIQSEPDWKYGKSTTKYLGEKNPKTSGDGDITEINAKLDDEDIEILEYIAKTLSEEKISSEELGKWSKETYLYQVTDFGSIMDFGGIKDEYVSQQVKDELTKLSEKFEKIDISEDSNIITENENI